MKVYKPIFDDVARNAFLSAEIEGVTLSDREKKIIKETALKRIKCHKTETK